MKSRLVVRAAFGLMVMAALPSAAYAQMAAEIIGQPVQVTTNG
jgi:hypothetical protein